MSSQYVIRNNACFVLVTCFDFMSVISVETWVISGKGVPLPQRFHVSLIQSAPSNQLQINRCKFSAQAIMKCREGGPVWIMK